MQPTIYRSAPSKSRADHLIILVVLLLFSFKSLGDLVSADPDGGVMFWWELVLTVLLFGFSALLIAQMAGFRALARKDVWNDVTLTLDDVGLTYRNGRFRRRWAWAALSAPEIDRRDECDEPAGPELRLDAQTIDWAARLFLRGVPLTGTEIRLPDVFDAPLSEIRAKLAQYRDRALAS